MIFPGRRNRNMFRSLTAEGRRMLDEIMVYVCRGSYDMALITLHDLHRYLPPSHEYPIRETLVRLERKEKKDLLIACQVLVAQMSPDLDENVIDTMNTQIPRTVLTKVYDLLVNESFKQIRKSLDHIQWVEHTIIWHTLVLYKHCTKMRAVKRQITELEFLLGPRFIELVILYFFTFTGSAYLLTFFF